MITCWPGFLASEQGPQVVDVCRMTIAWHAYFPAAGDDGTHRLTCMACCVLPPQTGPADNPWLSAISSHFAYWASADTALFVLRALHGLDVRQGVPNTALAVRHRDRRRRSGPRWSPPLLPPPGGMRLGCLLDATRRRCAGTAVY